MAQRTEIVLGNGVRAEVSLANAYGDPAPVRFESARLDVDGNVVAEGSAEVMADSQVLLTDGVDALAEIFSGTTAPAGAADSDPLGGVQVAPSPATARPGIAPFIPQTVEQALSRDAQAGIETPASRIVKGITGPDGFVDLTTELAQIDEAIKLDGIVIDGAVPSNSVAREQVLGAKFVVPQDAMSTKVVRLLYWAMREADVEMLVRWTKKVNQAQGVLVASAKRGALMLYEVQWADNARDTPAAARITSTDGLSDAERASAGSYVQRITKPAAVLADFCDERRALQADLVATTKVGDTFALPPVEPGADADLAAALAAPAS